MARRAHQERWESSFPFVVTLSKDLAAGNRRYAGSEGEHMVSPILPPGLVYHPADIKAYEVGLAGYNGDSVPAYVARPSAEGRYPGLLLVHGVHGYEEHMKDVARRFAALGYAAIVPALYSRNDFLVVVEEDDLRDAGSWLAARPHAQANGNISKNLVNQFSNKHT